MKGPNQRALGPTDTESRGGTLQETPAQIEGMGTDPSSTPSSRIREYSEGYFRCKSSDA